MRSDEGYLSLVLSPLDHFLNMGIIFYENIGVYEPFKPKKNYFLTQNLTKRRGQKRLTLIHDCSVVPA